MDKQVYPYEWRERIGGCLGHSTPDFTVHRTAWISMDPVDYDYLVQHFGDGDAEFGRCTHWLVYDCTEGTDEDDQERTIRVIPCAADGTSPEDCPMFEFAEYVWDSVIQRIDIGNFHNYM